MILTTDEYKKNLDGYFVYDCAVRSKNMFSFLLLQDIAAAAEGKKRILNIFTEDPEGKRTGMQQFKGLTQANIAASLYPKNQAVLVGLNCGVAVLGAGDEGMESPIPTGDDTKALLAGCSGLATIDGYVYGVGGWRNVCRRLGPNQWERLADRATLPEPKADKLGFPVDGAGFEAIAGFNANDIYCVGGKGDAWRFNGKRWHQCVMPTNMYFRSVCCAGDGYVYIGMQSGSVLRGRENKWKIIHKDEMTLAFKDMVWFDGKVWCTSDYGLWVIEDGKLKGAELPAEVTACAGNLSVGDGVMLLAGMYGATVYDGKTWTRLI